MKVAFSDFKAKGPLSKHIVRFQSSFDFYEKNLQEKIHSMQFRFEFHLSLPFSTGETVFSLSGFN